MRFLISGALVAALLLALPLCAQIDNGNITGRVTDPTGAVIAGAKVTVTQTDMNFETAATTNAEGIYWARNLRPGPYRVTVVAQGFKKLVHEGIDVSISQTLEINAALEVGALADSVEVTTNAVQLETETSSTGATVPGDYFYAFPNYQRNTKAVLFYTPGVSFSVGAYDGRFDNMLVNGMAAQNMSVFVDGALSTTGSTSATDPITNTVEDIKLITTSLPAEYGHGNGATMTVATKNGTNQLHGLMSEQFRTALMQQRKFWDLYKVNQAPPNWPSQPGLWVMNPDANMSGPVYIPKIYDGRNKTFFMFAWSGLLEKQSKQATDTVPTAAELGGDFSFGGVGNPIYDPTTTVCTPAPNCTGTFSGTTWSRQQFPNNVIPLNQFSKLAKTVLAMNPYRLPNVPGTLTSGGPSNNIMLGPMKVVVWDNYQIRLDHQFTPNLKAYGTYVYNSRHERQPPYTIANPFFDNTLNLAISPRQNTVSLGLTWVPTPTLVNDLHFSYYEYGNITESIAYNQNYAKTLGMSGLPSTCMPADLARRLLGESQRRLPQPGHHGNLHPQGRCEQVLGQAFLQDGIRAAPLARESVGSAKPGRELQLLHYLRRDGQRRHRCQHRQHFRRVPGRRHERRQFHHPPGRQPAAPVAEQLVHSGRLESDQHTDPESGFALQHRDPGAPEARGDQHLGYERPGQHHLHQHDLLLPATRLHGGLCASEGRGSLPHEIR